MNHKVIFMEPECYYCGGPNEPRRWSTEDEWKDAVCNGCGTELPPAVEYRRWTSRLEISIEDMMKFAKPNITMKDTS